MITNRQMRADELALILGWAAEEGWNPGLEDAGPFRAADPDGFFVACAGEEPVAAISVVNHSDSFAFLGLYLCRPEWRGRGIGLGLWRHALRHAGDRVIGLDGVPDQQANYRRSGFVRAGETFRFGGRLAGRSTAEVREIAAPDVASLIALEAAANGYAKPAFLAEWFAPAETRRTLVLDRGAGPVGCATVRRCGTGSKVGPLVAPDLAGADALLRAAAAAADGPLIVDVPDDCPALMDWCRAAGLAVSFNTARMYRGAAPVPGDGVRAIATLELG